MSKKPWSARFTSPTSELMHNFNSSLPFDRRLAIHDITVSIAHANMLGKSKIISKKDASLIVKGLKQIKKSIQTGKFVWNEKDEDVHSAIERVLTKKIGVAGKKLHTARSRNDQISTDLRLWLRDEIDIILVLLAKLRLALLKQATQHVNTLMPGMTHLQIAQPTTLAHHLHAHVCMLERDSQRLLQARSRTNLLPLGAAAFAGTSFNINPQSVAKELGFEGLCPNTMDAVADRDFAIEAAFICSLVVMHLSRLCEEIVIWSSQPFSFVRVDDAFSTGSSIMPQKRNPDAAELVRAKTGRSTGNLISLLIQGKAQPLAYNKDNQEDKEALFDSIDTTRQCLEVMTQMTKGLQFDVKRLAKTANQGFVTATDLADCLVREGVAFRDAHAIVAKTVALAEKQKVLLEQLSDKQLTKLTGIDASKVRKSLSVKHALKARKGTGAPAPSSMKLALKKSYALAEQDLKK